MRKSAPILAAMGLVAAVLSSPAQATPILTGDQYNLGITLGGNITFTDDTQSLSATPTVPGGAGYCIRAAGSSQNCGPSGISGTLSVNSSSITFTMYGSTGTSGTIDWSFTGLDFTPTASIIDVVAPSGSPISVTGFTSNSVSFHTASTDFTSTPHSFTFDLATPAPEPASVVLLSLGLIGIGATARRRKRSG